MIKNSYEDFTLAVDVFNNPVAVEDLSSIKDKSKQITKSMVEKSKEIANNTTDKVKDVGNATADATKNTAKKVLNKVDDIKDKTKDVADNVKKTITDKTAECDGMECDNFECFLTEVNESTKENIKDAANSVVKKVSDTAEDTIKTIKSIPKKIEDKILNVALWNFRRKIERINTIHQLEYTEKYLDDEVKAFDKAIEDMKKATSRYKAGKSTKIQFQNELKPVVKTLNHQISSFKLASFVKSNDNITSEEIGRLHNFMKKAKDIVIERKHALMNKQEEPKKEAKEEAKEGYIDSYELIYNELYSNK